MPVKITVTEKGNPLQPQQPKKWHAQTKSTGDATLRSLSKEITARSTVAPADTQAVLIALTDITALLKTCTGFVHKNISRPTRI